jgi:hypothetical protein
MDDHKGAGFLPSQSCRPALGCATMALDQRLLKEPRAIDDP